MDRRIVRLLVAGLLFATALFVLRDLLTGQFPGGEAGLAAARDAAGPWAEALWDGRIPLWDPAPPGGAPLLADPAAQVLHPLRVLHLRFGATAGLVLLLLVELSLFGTGMYALARGLGCSEGAALLAALGAQLSPLVASATGDPAVFASLCLAPWPVVFAVRISRHLRLRDAALAGASAALVLLAGSVELFLVACVASTVALAGGLQRGGPRLAALALVAGAIALLLPAAQWLPFLDAAGAGVFAPSAARVAPELLDLARVALPYTGVEPPRLPGRIDPWEAGHLLDSLYLGGPVLLLGLARPAAQGERRFLTAAFALVGVAAAPVAARWIARGFPGLGVVDPVTLAAPALLALPVLAAFGADALAGGRKSAALRRPPGSGRLALESTGALLVVLAVALALFASNAGLLLSASVAWILSGAVVLILTVRGVAGPGALSLPIALAVLVAVDLAGVHLLDSPFDRPAPAATAEVDPAGAPGAGGPRAVIAAGHEVLPREVARARATADGFDPREAVLLEAPPEAAADGGPGSARITRDDPEELHVFVEAPAGGWLLVADRWAPGWEAWVNGVPSPVLRANGSSRAVALPPGSYQVDLRYLPSSWPTGRALSAVGALLFLLAMTLERRGAKRRAGNELRLPNGGRIAIS